jgi:hypothetical protein
MHVTCEWFPVGQSWFTPGKQFLQGAGDLWVNIAVFVERHGYSPLWKYRIQKLYQPWSVAASALSQSTFIQMYLSSVIADGGGTMPTGT